MAIQVVATSQVVEAGNVIRAMAEVSRKCPREVSSPLPRVYRNLLTMTRHEEMKTHIIWDIETRPPKTSCDQLQCSTHVRVHFGRSTRELHSETCLFVSASMHAPRTHAEFAGVSLYSFAASPGDTRMPSTMSNMLGETAGENSAESVRMSFSSVA